MPERFASISYRKASFDCENSKMGMSKKVQMIRTFNPMFLFNQFVSIILIQFSSILTFKSNA
jgi:hypothetical protein